MYILNREFSSACDILDLIKEYKNRFIITIKQNVKVVARLNLMTQRKQVIWDYETKIRAIDRVILKGESKASVSRGFKVPESTLRGWVNALLYYSPVLLAVIWLSWGLRRSEIFSNEAVGNR